MIAIPSLINRAYILDLMPGASLLQFLRSNGMRPLLFEWGDAPGAERQLNVDRLILERLKPALDSARRRTGKRPVVLGYCMGGTLATALACLYPDDVAGLALLATPWNFHNEADSPSGRRPCYRSLTCSTGTIGSATVDILQTLFAQIDPTSVPRKFARFGRMAPTSKRTSRFVAVEDWLNDGVPLGAEVANTCFTDWYGNNAPACGHWKVDGYAIRPERLHLPTCLAIPERDRIVPPGSTFALADSIPNRECIRPTAGHVGMVVGRNAEVVLWRPLARWLTRIAAMQKTSW